MTACSSKNACGEQKSRTNMTHPDSNMIFFSVSGVFLRVCVNQIYLAQSETETVRIQGYTATCLNWQMDEQERCSFVLFGEALRGLNGR